MLPVSHTTFASSLPWERSRCRWCWRRKECTALSHGSSSTSRPQSCQRPICLFSTWLWRWVGFRLLCSHRQFFSFWIGQRGVPVHWRSRLTNGTRFKVSSMSFLETPVANSSPKSLCLITAWHKHIQLLMSSIFKIEEEPKVKKRWKPTEDLSIALYQRTRAGHGKGLCSGAGKPSCQNRTRSGSFFMNSVEREYEGSASRSEETACLHWGKRTKSVYQSKSKTKRRLANVEVDIVCASVEKRRCGAVVRWNGEYWAVGEQYWTKKERGRGILLFLCCFHITFPTTLLTTQKNNHTIRCTAFIVFMTLSQQIWGPLILVLNSNNFAEL